MESGDPWNPGGLRPQARDAARRPGVSIAEWLNSVVAPADAADGEPIPPAEFDRQRPKASNGRPARLTDAPARPPRRGLPALLARCRPDGERAADVRRASAGQEGQGISIDQAIAEIMARQQALDAVMPAPAPVTAPISSPLRPGRLEADESDDRLPTADTRQSASAPPLALDQSRLERQLRQITMQIEALRAPAELENASLAKVAEDVRALSAKVELLANSTASGHALALLEKRIDMLADALNASTEAGGALPQELQRLLGALLEKLESMRLTQTDHAALAHTEDRLAMPVKRLDASDPPKLEPFEPPLQRPAAARLPLDPNLPPNHPLEPGSAAGRTHQPPPAADRIAAPEAAMAAKPLVLPNPDGKPDFIMAARRAAQAAAASFDRPSAGNTTALSRLLPKPPTERLRKLIVAAAVVLTAIGCGQIVARRFAGGSSAPLAAVPARRSPTPAPARPAVSSTALPEPIPLPLDLVGNAGTPSGANPTAAGPPPATTTSGKPGQQAMNDGLEPSAKAIGAPLGPDQPAASTTSIRPPPEVTGALPTPLAPSGGATPAAAAATSKLPAAIGTPALRAAALAGDASAAYLVAMHFAEGRGVPQNNEEAARWFARAAAQGLVPAQYRLGARYEKGVGVKKDLAAARDLYRAAADKGHGKAMHNLGVLYAQGVGGAADYHTAAQWFRKAADRGIIDSQYNLAVLYARGLGVEQNLAEAYKWFFLAAKAGDKAAAAKRDEVASRLDQQSLAIARRAAERWIAEPQPPDAITVTTPADWDVSASATPSAKAKTRSPAGKAQPENAGQQSQADRADR